jgi:mono/diheme cytochrome c family protein
MRITTKLAALSSILALPAIASAADDRPWVGDPTNGAKLYAKECAACHGEGGAGGRSGVSMRDSGRMAILRDDQIYAVLKSGAGVKKEKDHKFESKLGYLELWDVVSYLRSLHMSIGDFFPDASHYVSKEYTIDEHGLTRIQESTKKPPISKTGGVFTFFKKDGSDAQLEYVPQDPIKLDQLKKKEKRGYLVFLPLETQGFKGEVGVGMDAQGKITKLLVHNSEKNADLLNKSLSRFEGLGKKGQKEPFKPGGGKEMVALSDDVFRIYQSAMELATMYDRDENERTWADSE